MNKLPVDPKTILPRSIVRDAEGELIGSVEEVFPWYFRMSDHRLSPKSYFIPADEVASYEEGVVRLKATVEQVRLSAWDQGPPPEPP